ncbi:MAG: hypothetical protein ACJAYE_003432 [Candidatus Azotimanducaceae bacterium]|jgi:hypothetical protein
MNQNMREVERQASLQRMIHDLEVEMQRLVTLLVKNARLNQ